MPLFVIQLLSEHLTPAVLQGINLGSWHFYQTID